MSVYTSYIHHVCNKHIHIRMTIHVEHPVRRCKKLVSRHHVPSRSPDKVGHVALGLSHCQWLFMGGKRCVATDSMWSSCCRQAWLMDYTRAYRAYTNWFKAQRALLLLIVGIFTSQLVFTEWVIGWQLENQMIGNSIAIVGSYWVGGSSSQRTISSRCGDVAGKI